MPIHRPVRRAATTAATTAVLVAIALGASLAGCKRQASPDTTASDLPSADARALFPPDQDSERTWVGLLPCSDCQGVDTRLVLRMHGNRRDYLLTETYLATGGSQRFNRAGAWVEAMQPAEGDDQTVFQLDPAQSGQRFLVQPDGALELLDGNGQPHLDPVPYRLQRL